MTTRPRRRLRKIVEDALLMRDRLEIRAVEHLLDVAKIERRPGRVRGARGPRRRQRTAR